MKKQKTKKVRQFAFLPVFMWAFVVLALCVLPGFVIFKFVKSLPGSGGDFYVLAKEFIRFVRSIGITIKLDKVAHFGMYFILGSLILPCCYFSGLGVSAKTISFSSIIGAGYGYGTEYLQKYCSTRSYDLHDACANLIGLACGMLLGLIIVAILKVLVFPFKVIIDQAELA